MAVQVPLEKANKKQAWVMPRKKIAKSGDGIELGVGDRGKTSDGPAWAGG
jgi:hypothetical protein